jgi:prevent-host-death family protein
MTINTWDSNEARTRWRELLDTTAAGEADVVITRYGKPVSVVIDYEDYLALQDELDDLRSARRAAAIYAEWKAGRVPTRNWEDVKADLMRKGLLDDE